MAATEPVLLDRTGTAFERRHVDGDGVAYAEVGSGHEVVVLIHGTLTALDDMLIALGPYMPDQRLIALDRPGFGASTRQTLVDAGVFRQAHKLNQALAALQVRRAILVGHSFGAAVALAMALLEPARTAGVVALAPLVLPELRLEHLLFGPRAVPWWGGALSNALHGGIDRTLLPVLWRDMFLPQPMPDAMETRFPFALAGQAGATARVGEDCLAAGPDLTALLALAPILQAPLSVLGGDADLVVNNRLHGALWAALAPDGRFSLLPRVGHMIHHAAPERVVQAVADVRTRA
jgi:pimeloyl-ACP methyl ester carboxylesterase